MKGYTINLEWLINKLMKKNSPFNNSNWLLMINQMTIKVSKSQGKCMKVKVSMSWQSNNF